MENDNKTMQIESAIFLLKDGILNDNQTKIDRAKEVLNKINWFGYEVLEMEYIDLLKQTTC